MNRRFAQLSLVFLPSADTGAESQVLLCQCLGSWAQTCPCVMIWTKSMPQLDWMLWLETWLKLRMEENLRGEDWQRRRRRDFTSEYPRDCQWWATCAWGNHLDFLSAYYLAQESWLHWDTLGCADVISHHIGKLTADGIEIFNVDSFSVNKLFPTGES